MKTNGLILLLICTFSLHFAYGQSSNHEHFKKVPIEKAIKDHHLVKAMYQQIDISIIENEHQHYYMAKVKYRHSTYIIFGKLDQWINFFVMDPSTPSIRLNCNDKLPE